MLKAHIGLDLESQMKQLHWSYPELILDATQSSDRSFCVKSVYLLPTSYYSSSANTRVFRGESHATYWTTLQRASRKVQGLWAMENMQRHYH